MHIQDSLFFNQLIFNLDLRSKTATAELEDLRAVFADPDFDQQRDILTPSATNR